MRRVPPLITILVVAICCSCRQSDKPGFGQTSKQETTIATLAKCEDFQSIERTIRAISQRDDAVPLLVLAIQDERHFVRLSAATALSEIGDNAVSSVSKLLIHNDEDVRSWAIAILCSMGESASEAVPLLKPILNDEKSTIAEIAAVALAQIGGNDVAQIFVENIGHRNKAIRMQSASFLGSVASSIAVPALITALNDSDAEIRQLAIISMRDHYESPELLAAIPEITKLLQDSDAAVRTKTADLFCGLGEKSTSVIPMLITALENELSDDSELYAENIVLTPARSMINALAAIGPDAINAIPIIQKAVDHRNSYVQSSAENALKALQSPNKNNTGQRE